VTLPLLATLLRHAARSIRHGGLPFFFATLMAALGLFGLAVFGTVLLNLQRVADTVGESIGAVAFLDTDSAVAAEETRTRIELLDGVSGARLVTPEEALVRVRRSLGDSGGVLTQDAAGVGLGWVVEVQPDVASGATAGSLASAISKVAGVDEVMHPGGEVERVRALMRLLRGAGIFLALLVGMVTIIVVSNTVKLTLFARRDEIAIMKLVGATDVFVRVPFLIEGLVQGILGSGAALAAVYLLHATIAGLLKVALSGAMGAFVLEPLPVPGALLILAGGAVLGTLGATLSLGRFLRV
jgi:cell division transport system permease protein